MHGERNGEEGNRDADADGRPPPQPPPPSPPATGSEAKNPRDRVSFPSSSGTRPRPSCWGRIRIHRVGLSRGRSRTGGDGHETAPAVRAVVSSLICAGDRGRGRRGKADVAAAAAGARSLLQRNDFYCDDCNTHR
ncbi:hypothetical protein SEVIR_5G034500v4 [Setaria viridis]|uniref:Uncharacterized protein n=3 Tax=Setaria TaxID=4554 RepID=A0A368R2S2_SETIT|nr:uncharacterized protein LOC101763936 [Setaria italica]RCV23830.1 hypothetical protein SETIT_5G036200v2 [Setaria italica]TKW12418.1 hypothetical protein SEVIR_5G034500v2 [Setaria viridis]